MLVRNVSRVLAADLRKLSTQSSTSRSLTLQRIVVRSIFGGYRSSLGRRLHTRTYATASKGTQTKKTGEKKQTRKKPVTEKSEDKKTTAKKRAPKKQTKAAKKPAAKKPRTKKVLTPEETKSLLIKDLKKKALLGKTDDERLPPTAWTVFLAQHLQGKSSTDMPEVAKKWRETPASERHQYEETAQKNKKAREEKHQAWIKALSGEEVRVANNARLRLNRIAKEAKTGNVRIHGLRPRYQLLKDDRSPTSSRNAFTFFFQSRIHSGDFQGLSMPEAMRQSRQEWVAMSDTESKPFRDSAEADKLRYNAAYAAYNPDRKSSPKKQKASE